MGNVSKLFLLIEQEKFGNIAHSKIKRDRSCVSNAKVGECFF